ncbi:MAG: histidine phosphatase family protein [Pseudomonadota bacterium]
MRRLILMRHAKSSWDDPDQADIDRPLNARGRLAAGLMGAWLAEEGLIPDHALLSPARRVAETWDRVAAALGREATAATVPKLYHAAPEDALAAMAKAPDGAQTLILIGHEPGATALLRRLSDGSEGGGCRRAYEKFPTAGVAVLEFDAKRWKDVAPTSGRFARFASPKDLV